MKDPSATCILLVDDETVFGEMLSEMLRMKGYQTRVCSSSEDALLKMEQRQFDLVLSDFRLPGMNGQQLYETAVQRQPVLAKRFIFLTGDVLNQDAHRFIESVGCRFLTKPFKFEKVKEIVQQVLEESQDALTDDPT